MSREELFKQIRETVRIEIHIQEFEELINKLVRLEVEEKLKELQEIYSKNGTQAHQRRKNDNRRTK